MTKESYNKTVFAKMEITMLSNTTIDENKKSEKQKTNFEKLDQFFTWTFLHLFSRALFAKDKVTVKNFCI